MNTIVASTGTTFTSLKIQKVKSTPAYTSSSGINCMSLALALLRFRPRPDYVLSRGVVSLFLGYSHVARTKEAADNL